MKKAFALLLAVSGGMFRRHKLRQHACCKRFCSTCFIFGRQR